MSMAMHELSELTLSKFQYFFEDKTKVECLMKKYAVKFQCLENTPTGVC